MAEIGPYTVADNDALGPDPIYDAAMGMASWEQVVDFSKPENNMAIGDTMLILKIPAGIVLMGAVVQTLVVEGAAAVVDVGITGGDVDGYIDGADVNALGNVISGDAGVAEPIAMSNNGRMTDGEELVSVLLAGAPMANAKVRFKIFGADMRSLINDSSSL